MTSIQGRSVTPWRARAARLCAACLVFTSANPTVSHAVPLPASDWHDERKPRAERLSGFVYRLGAGATVLYRFEMDRDDARGRWRSRYFDRVGRLATEDEVLFRDGALMRYGYVRRTIGEVSSVERRGKRLVYTRVLDGRRDESEEDDRDDFTVGPTVALYVQRHWTALVAGQRLGTRYGVLDRLRSYGFELERDDRHPRAARDAVVVRMRPSSAFLRLFVSPVHLVFSRDGSVLREIIGRMLPVERRDGRLHAVDGDLVMTAIDAKEAEGP